MNDISSSSVDWSAVRDEFPALDGCVHLNTASRGLVPRAAMRAGCNYYEQMCARADVGFGSVWNEALESARADVAGFVGADPSCLAFVANASNGLNLGIDLLNEPGEVLVHGDEFPSVSLPWLQRGHAVRFLSPDAGGVVRVDAFAAAMSRATRFVSVSAVQYASGYAIDLPALGELCRERGVYLFVDATQAVGSMALEMERIQPDVLVFSGYKWLLSGYGIAGLYVAPKHLGTKQLPGAGWRSALAPYALVNDVLSANPAALALEYGNPLLPGPLALQASVRLLGAIGIGAIRRRSLELQVRLREGLKSLGLTLRSPERPEDAGSICMFEVPDAARLERRLGEERVYVSARQGLIRVSPHFYNNEPEIDAFLHALRACL